jgi:Domain of unknown function (DUF4157)
MKIYAQKQNRPQQHVSSDITRSSATLHAPTHVVHPITHLQHKIGNQPVQALPRANAEGRNVGSSTCAPPRFAHDFSRIPLYSKAPAGLQTKLTVNTPGDIYEQEADRISGQVMSMPEPQLQRACACGGRCPTCMKEQGGREQLQAKNIEPVDAVATTVPPSLQEVTRSSGEALDLPTRKFMEPRFGHDFSQVRIHTDALAQQSARDVNARAYTLGRNIVFAAGEYSPHTHAGRHLLAHELVHVTQQSASQPTALIQREEEGERDAPVPTTPTSPPVASPPAAGGAPTAEITLETGNFGAGFLNDLVHQQICVNGYSADASKRCFSFAATGLQAPQFSQTWLGWSSWVTGAVIQGEVYEPPPVSTATVVGRHTPTATQGATWLSYMTGTRLGLQDAYSVARHNCRAFSQWEFRDAPSHW